MNEGNVLDQLYHQIEERFTSNQNEEYLCIVHKGIEIKMNESLSSIRQSIEDNRLTNCFCAPYEVVNRIMPTSLSSRYAFILATWVCSRQILYKDRETWLYGSEEAYLKKMKDQMQEFEDIFMNHDDNLNWKSKYDALYQFIVKMMQHFQKQGELEESFGERELQEAKELLRDMRILLPQQSYIYPTILQPENWRTMLSTSFTQMDMVPSIAEGIHQLLKTTALREHQIKQLLFYKEDTMEIQHYQKERQEYLTKAVKNIPRGCDAYDQQVLFQLGMSILSPKNLCARFYRALNQWLHKKQKTVSLHHFFITMEEQRLACEKAYQEMCRMPYTDLLLQDILKTLQDLNQQHQKQCFLLEAANRKSLLQQTDENRLLPQSIPDGYEKVIIKGTIADLISTSLYCEKGIGLGLHVLFGNAIPTGIDEEKCKKVTMELGCLVTQVQIHRPWFKEEVFDFSSTYIRLRDHCVAHGGKSLKNRKNDILPSYPSRMILAKDVTIRFHFQQGKSMLKLFKRHANHGNGFLCFHDGSRNGSFLIDQDGDVLTIRYPKAYLLGYFMHYTPKDESRKAQGG